MRDSSVERASAVAHELRIDVRWRRSEGDFGADIGKGEVR